MTFRVSFIWGSKPFGGWFQSWYVGLGFWKFHVIHKVGFEFKGLGISCDDWEWS